jgi:hypothetical protein
MKDYVLYAAWILLAVVLVVNVIRLILAVARICRSVREKERAVEAVYVNQAWRREESDPDGDPWIAPVTIYLRVMEIKHNAKGVKWCRCVRYCRTEEGCQSTEINLRAEQIVDEYEQYE